MDLPADDAEAEHTALVVEDLEPLAAAGGSTGQGYARAPSPPLPRPSVAASGDQGGARRAAGPCTRGRLRMAAGPYARRPLGAPVAGRLQAAPPPPVTAGGALSS